MRTTLRGLAAMTLSLIPLVIVAPAAAAPPTSETFTFHTVYSDSGYAANCGLEEVIVTLDARVLIRYWEEDARRLGEVRNVHSIFTLASEDNTYRLATVGATTTRLAPDGTAIMTLAGQRPEDFIGVAKVNLFTGELILETPHGFDWGRICAALTRR